MSKKPVAARTVKDRRRKVLYLPLEKAEADRLSLHARLTFERVRQGSGDRAAVFGVRVIILVCQVLTREGFGHLPLDLLLEAGREMDAVIDAGLITDTWEMQEALVARLNSIVNEYDRLMRETRLQAIIDASEAVDRILSRKT